MDFQPLPKGGDACLWAGVFAVRALPGGCGWTCSGSFAACSLHSV